MQSSVQRAYERVINDDGSIDLKFEGKRFGQESAAPWLLVSLILYPATCAITMPIFSMAKNASGGLFVVWLAVSFVVWFFTLWWFTTTSHTVKVKPGVSLISDGTHLPFADISRMGTKTDGKTTVVYVVSHGTEVRVGKYLKPALAGSLIDEIAALSGKTLF